MLRSKYPITDWVLSRECVKVGELIAFWDDELNQEIHAEIIGFPSEEHRQYLSIKRINCEYTECINYYNTIVYKIGRSFNLKCTCGAKFTSNPKYHLQYCDIQG